MSTIPPHYPKQFVHQRFRKALHIVQHYSSALEPTKDQKLELYALFKQASTGNVNSQRPGIFDMVGRAKWDAWKQLEGLSQLEARHRYVEAFLRLTSEAYRKPASRAQAQQILQAFATMQPSAFRDDSSDDDEDEDNDDEESSVVAEERAYLRDIHHQERPPRRQPSLRPPSAASTQISAITAPSTPLGRPGSAISHRIRPPQSQALLHGGPPGGGDDESLILDPNVNPWVSSSKGIDARATRRESLLSPFDRSPSTSTPESHHYHHHQQQPSNNGFRIAHMSSPSPSAVSTAHTVTRPSSNSASPLIRPDSVATQQQEHTSAVNNTSVVALGPATKRALETLEAEIIALNERIDGLKQELRASIPSTAGSSSATAPRKRKRAGLWPWRWLAKMVLRHTAVHILLLVVFAFYIDQNPIALIVQIMTSSHRNKQRSIA